MCPEAQETRFLNGANAGLDIDDNSVMDAVEKLVLDVPDHHPAGRPDHHGQAGARAQGRAQRQVTRAQWLARLYALS